MYTQRTNVGDFAAVPHALYLNGQRRLLISVLFVKHCREGGQGTDGGREGGRAGGREGRRAKREGGRQKG